MRPSNWHAQSGRPESHGRTQRFQREDAGTGIPEKKQPSIIAFSGSRNYTPGGDLMLVRPRILRCRRNTAGVFSMHAPMIEIRLPRTTDATGCAELAALVIGEDRAGPFFKSVEAVSPSPRVFSSTEETNAASIRMHTALGFQPSGHIDNLPQGTRELLFYKRIPPRSIR